MANTPREQMIEYVADLADGEDVWCDWAQKPARTADGFCQWCGSTRHGKEGGGGLTTVMERHSQEALSRSL